MFIPKRQFRVSQEATKLCTMNSKITTKVVKQRVCLAGDDILLLISLEQKIQSSYNQVGQNCEMT